MQAIIKIKRANIEKKDKVLMAPPPFNPYK
jgi:hypothetical protein